MTIKITIADKRATVEGTPVIVCGNSDYYIEFTFDAEWAGADVKTARFVYVQNDVVEHQDVVFTGSTVNVPVLFDTREVKVGVFAGNLQTTTPGRIPCEPSIRCGTGAPADPTPDQYDQIMDLLMTFSVEGGKSAYEIAVENGFQGTEVEWLESLKGAKGDPGADGKAPVRGVDYWTDADKAELVKEVENTAIGDIETALDGIIAIQNELIGGDGV